MTTAISKARGKRNGKPEIDEFDEAPAAKAPLYEFTVVLADGTTEVVVASHTGHGTNGELVLARGHSFTGQVVRGWAPGQWKSFTRGEAVQE